ncbi:MAG: helix-turn-helix transcriptional regulator [Saprospiraceae bacterium]|nr:helix-turn-helix transcriptional regulator [Saprospiraceae bacterium]
MGVKATVAPKNTTTLEEHLSRRYGERGTAARETLHANAFAEYVGVIVQEYREQNGLTQQELAERLGVKKSYLSRIENGKADIRLSTLAKVLGSIGFDIVAMPQKSGG